MLEEILQNLKILTIFPLNIIDNDSLEKNYTNFKQKIKPHYFIHQMDDVIINKYSSSLLYVLSEIDRLLMQDELFFNKHLETILKTALFLFSITAFSLNFPSGIGMPISHKNQQYKCNIHLNDNEEQNKQQILISLDKLMDLKCSKLCHIVFNELAMDILTGIIYTCPNSYFQSVDRILLIPTQQYLKNLIILRQGFSIKAIRLTKNQIQFKKICSQLISSEIKKPNGIFSLKASILKKYQDATYQSLEAICKIVMNPQLITPEQLYYEAILSEIEDYIINEDFTKEKDNAYIVILLTAIMNKKYVFFENLFEDFIFKKFLSEKFDNSDIDKLCNLINILFIKNKTHISLDILYNLFLKLLNTLGHDMSPFSYSQIKMLLIEYFNETKLPKIDILKSFIEDWIFIENHSNSFSNLVQLKDLNVDLLTNNKTKILFDIILSQNDTCLNNQFLIILVTKICKYVETISSNPGDFKYNIVSDLMLNLNLLQQSFERLIFDLSTLYKGITHILLLISKLYSNAKIDLDANIQNISLYVLLTLLESLNILMSKLVCNKSISLNQSIEQCLKLQIPNPLVSQIICIKNQININQLNLECDNETMRGINQIMTKDVNIGLRELWKDLSSEIPPIKGGAILSLQKMLKQGRFFNNRGDIVKLLVCSLLHNDSYVHTAAISTLVYLTFHNPGCVLPILVDNFRIPYRDKSLNSNFNTQKEEIRNMDIKIGEVLTKLIEKHCNKLNEGNALLIFNKIWHTTILTERNTYNIYVISSGISIISSLIKHYKFGADYQGILNEEFVGNLELLFHDSNIQEMSIQNGIIIMIRNIFECKFTNSSKNNYICDSVYQNLYKLLRHQLNDSSCKDIRLHKILALKEIEEHM